LIDNLEALALSGEGIGRGVGPSVGHAHQGDNRRKQGKK
jgi:hypothetical protein